MPERTIERTAAAVKRPPRNPQPAPHAPVHAPAPVWDADGAHAPGAPSAVLAVQRAAGNQAVMRMLDARRPGHPLAGPATAVQKLSEDELDDDDDDVQRSAATLHEPSDEAIRSAAVEGVRTPSTTLPHLDRIQARFGRHSIAHIQAHVGPEAARASRAMNALAYASGGHVVFGAEPDLRTAAHEAAHIVQQQAGVQLSGGIGRAGDPYERHADEVADAVVAGRPAEGLLPFFVPSPKAPQPDAEDVARVQRTADGSSMFVQRWLKNDSNEPRYFPMKMCCKDERYYYLYHGTHAANLMGETGIGQKGLDPKMGGGITGIRGIEGIPSPDAVGWMKYAADPSLAMTYAMDYAAKHNKIGVVLRVGVKKDKLKKFYHPKRPQPPTRLEALFGKSDKAWTRETGGENVTSSIEERHRLAQLPINQDRVDERFVIRALETNMPVEADDIQVAGFYVPAHSSINEVDYLATLPQAEQLDILVQ